MMFDAPFQMMERLFGDDWRNLRVVRVLQPDFQIVWAWFRHFMALMVTDPRSHSELRDFACPKTYLKEPDLTARLLDQRVLPACSVSRSYFYSLPETAKPGAE